MSDWTSCVKSATEKLKKFQVKGTVTLYGTAWWISGRRDIRGFPLLACLIQFIQY